MWIFCAAGRTLRDLARASGGSKVGLMGSNFGAHSERDCSGEMARFCSNFSSNAVEASGFLCIEYVN